MIMSEKSDDFSNIFLSQIQSLLNDRFIERLSLGKYSRWAIGLSIEEVAAIFSAVGEIGLSGTDFPILEDTFEEFRGIENYPPELIILNDRQQNALFFFTRLFRKNLIDGFSIPDEYTCQSSNFRHNVEWAYNPTKGDLFGILWHVGGLAIRSNRQNISSIDQYHIRAQEHLICLIRVAQGQATYYQFGGSRMPLRQPPPQPRNRRV
jgi:hypothetical protein